MYERKKRITRGLKKSHH